MINLIHDTKCGSLDSKENIESLNFTAGKKLIKPRSKRQVEYFNLVRKKNLVFCCGPAGTGKTYISVYKALQDVLRRGTGYDKLIIINPSVDVGNEDKLGYLPGELDKKIQQYNESTFTILDKIVGRDKATKM